MENDYQKIREIGHGGMSVVYLARMISTGKLVAVKILKTASTTDREYIQRFFREARITARLNHPHIIRILESNFSRVESIFYIVTEYIDGGDFHQLLSPMSSISISNSPIGLKTKFQILIKILSALDYAHQVGIVHRDIKPSNILLTQDLEPRLCDFGIAASLWGQEIRFTQTNEILGTMDYIAPEQKEDSRQVDLRADIFSMGVIFYQLVTGRKPLGAFPSPIQVCASLPEKLDQIIMKCLQPLPSDRYKSASNLALEIRDILHLIPDFLPLQKTKDTGISNQTDDITQIDSRSAKFYRMIEKLQHGSVTEKLNIRSQFLDFIGRDKNYEEKLISLLPDSDGFLKETIIQALGKIKSSESCTLLIELLSDPYYNKAAADAIGEIGCKEAEEKLYKLLLARTEKSHIALIPLGKLNSSLSVPLIAEYLSDRHSWIRESALNALGMITDPRIDSFLNNAAFKDPDPNIRAKAKKILWRSKK